MSGGDRLPGSGRGDAADAGGPPAGTGPASGAPARPEPGPSEPRGALRLTFAYTGDEVTIVSQQHVDMLAPAGEAARIEPGQPGFWVELRDERGEVLYQQTLHHPVRHEAEVFSPEGSITTVPVEPTGTFQVVVPDLPHASAVVVHGSAGPGEARLAPSAELATFDARATVTPQEPETSGEGEPEGTGGSPA
jgi:hypothetical protein